ncbi:glycosyltransferase family 4 protein [Chryseobacterium sp. CCH4-E10]|uniref:glycosyltransferase family 4 protein n=1 Tax=Chryseobacterium sp. CCH4-E10 TaxID=1768758 RepID=UPI000830EE1D|nr:glycosyltransferase family 4 protein [Chryseobacterium sp. CCH4-E10]
MRILIITQYFYPENFKSNDLAFELKKRGHDVTVLTGIPNYPEGKIYEGYGYFKKRMQYINDVKIIRTWLLPRGNGGGLRLFLNYFSWAFFASLKALQLSSKKYDAIIVHEPSPITQFYPALVIKKIQKTPIYFWVMDLWPESLEIAGGVKNKFILNFFTKMVRNFYKESEKILITSKGFKKSILEKGNFENKIHYFPNWAEDTISSGNKEFTIPKLPEGFRIMFAGNIGEAQDMENIMKAALTLRENKNIKFILLGDGRKMPFVQEFIRENQLEETVYTLGRFPVEAMATFFNAADILLVSLKDDPIFNITVPAKVQAYMSSGKPILAMLNGEGAENIAEAACGFSVPAGNSEELATAIKRISQMKKEDLLILGRNGKQFYELNYKMEHCISNLEKIISPK